MAPSEPGDLCGRRARRIVRVGLAEDSTVFPDTMGQVQYKPWRLHKVYINLSQKKTQHGKGEVGTKSRP